MKKNSVAIMAVAAFIFVSLGCSSILAQEHRGTITGELTGALSGGAVGNFAIDQKRSAVDTASSYHYREDAGTLVRIESFVVEPYTVKSGGQVEFVTTYVVMIPDFSMTIPVEVSHEIRHNRELVGKPAVTVDQAAGTYSSSVPLLLPAKAPAGTYKVITTIRAGDIGDSKETTFVVI